VVAGGGLAAAPVAHSALHFENLANESAMGSGAAGSEAEGPPALVGPPVGALAMAWLMLVASVLAVVLRLEDAPAVLTDTHAGPLEAKSRPSDRPAV